MTVSGPDYDSDLPNSIYDNPVTSNSGNYLPASLILFKIKDENTSAINTENMTIIPVLYRSVPMSKPCINAINSTRYTIVCSIRHGLILRRMSTAKSPIYRNMSASLPAYTQKPDQEENTGKKIDISPACIAFVIGWAVIRARPV